MASLAVSAAGSGSSAASIVLKVVLDSDGGRKQCRVTLPHDASFAQLHAAVREKLDLGSSGHLECKTTTVHTALCSTTSVPYHGQPLFPVATGFPKPQVLRSVIITSNTIIEYSTLRRVCLAGGAWRRL